MTWGISLLACDMGISLLACEVGISLLACDVGDISVSMWVNLAGDILKAVMSSNSRYITILRNCYFLLVVFTKTCSVSEDQLTSTDVCSGHSSSRNVHRGRRTMYLFSPLPGSNR